jgi:ABC-type oligopeptide transport system ATPase subunit
VAEVAFERVTKVFDDGTRAVSELSLDVGDGEFVVLVGPSGCGKTTAVRMVAGLKGVTEGEIRIGGEVVTRSRPGDSLGWDGPHRRRALDHRAWDWRRRYGSQHGGRLSAAGGPRNGPHPTRVPGPGAG